MKKGIKLGGCIILGILIIGFAAVIMMNRIHSDYRQLDETDRFILKELHSYGEAAEKNDVWKDFALEGKTVLAIKGSFGSAYLVNPAHEINSIFAKKIQMPTGYRGEVYRISLVSPQLLKFRFDGNFNTAGKTYDVYGNDVFYTKYEEEDVTKKFVSSHYITFLTHEAFHYYMQGNWAAGDTYSAEAMSEEDSALLYKEYEVLAKIQKALINGKASRGTYLKYAKEYTAAVKARMEKNPEYVRKELDRETIEGTATYVGIKASQIVGYDFGVMYFDNAKHVPFSDLKQAVESGVYDRQELAGRIPYETGALLCLLMDKLEIPDWQEKLNRQTKEKQLTLYEVIREFTDSVQ